MATSGMLPDNIGSPSDDDDEDSSLDPRVKDYLSSMLQQGQRTMSPDYRASLGASRLADTQNAIDRSSMAGVAEGLSKLGTLGGKSPDVKPFTTTLAGLNQADQQREAQNAADQSDQERQFGMNAKVLEYLQGQRDKANALQANLQSRSDQAEANRDLKEQLAAQGDQTRRDIASTRANITIQNMSNRSDQSGDKTDAKTSRDQAKSYADMRKSLETFRGNNAAQQASKDVLSADKALSLVDGKDPNTLTVQDLRLLSDELGKIASGGVPGEHGVEALMPNNLQSKWAEMKNFVLSEPTDAQAGAYIQHNLKYLQDMRDTAKKTIGDYRLNIAKGYRGLVNQDDYAEALSDYGLGGSSGQPGATPAAPQSPAPPPPQRPTSPVQGGPGTAVAAPAPTAKSAYKDGDTKTIPGRGTYIRRNGAWDLVQPEATPAEVPTYGDQ